MNKPCIENRSSLANHIKASASRRSATQLLSHFSLGALMITVTVFALASAQKVFLPKPPSTENLAAYCATAFSFLVSARSAMLFEAMIMSCYVAAVVMLAAPLVAGLTRLLATMKHRSTFRSHHRTAGVLYSSLIAFYRMPPRTPTPKGVKKLRSWMRLRITLFKMTFIFVIRR